MQGLIKPFTGFAEAALQEEGNLSERKAKLEKELSKQTALRFLVVVDDLDRLNRNEIRLVVQLIKAVGNLPNVSYLLAIDWNIVAKALDGEQTGESGTGESYLSKIIQDRIPVPPVNKFRLRDLVKTSVDKIFARYNEKCDWSFQPLLCYVLEISNLREAKKYIRSLEFYASAFGDSIDPSDLAAIVAIKMLDPNLYRLILKYRSSLLGQSYQDESNKEFNKEVLATRLGKKSQVYCLAVCSDLFPNMFGSISKDDEVVTNNHLRNPEVFDQFVQMTPSDVDDSTAKIANAVSLDGDVFAMWCLQSDKDRVVKTFQPKALGLFKKGLIGEIISLLVHMADCGVDQSLINDCIGQMNSFFSLYDHQYFLFADALLDIQDPVQGLEIAYEVLSLEKMDHLMSDRKMLNELFKELVGRLIKVSGRLFNLPTDCFFWACKTFDSIGKFCNDIQDEDELYKLLKLAGRRVTDSFDHPNNPDFVYCGLSKIAYEKIDAIKPFIQKWIEGSTSSEELSLFLPIAMYISKTAQDRLIDGLPFYKLSSLINYAAEHFPSRVDDLKEDFSK